MSNASGYGLCHPMDLNSSHNTATYQLVSLGMSLQVPKSQFFSSVKWE